MIGGSFTVEPKFDGAHAITFWNKTYSETDDFVLVEFLEDVHGFSVKKGERRRLRRSDAREMRHEYTDSHEGPQPAIPRWPATIKILEPRPRNTFLSPDEVNLGPGLRIVGMDLAATRFLTYPPLCVS
jgi:hypothetical protein